METLVLGSETVSMKLPGSGRTVPTGTAFLKKLSPDGQEKPKGQVARSRRKPGAVVPEPRSQWQTCGLSRDLEVRCAAAGRRLQNSLQTRC